MMSLRQPETVRLLLGPVGSTGGLPKPELLLGLKSASGSVSETKRKLNRCSAGSPSWIGDGQKPYQFGKRCARVAIFAEM
jgi:hypothetical protein